MHAKCDVPSLIILFGAHQYKQKLSPGIYVSRTSNFTVHGHKGSCHFGTFQQSIVYSPVRISMMFLCDLLILVLTLLSDLIGCTALNDRMVLIGEL
jgi:hypothetical protein